MEENREVILRRRIKTLTWLFIVGLVVAGVTAIPLRSELDLLATLLGANANSPSPLAEWIRHVQAALNQTTAQFPFLFYGTDWLAFGHFVIAIAFIGALRDPVRNSWLYTFGMISCALIVPYALVFGGLRGIPLWWRLVDCSFGVFGFVPVWLCKKWADELESANQQVTLPIPPLFHPLVRPETCREVARASSPASSNNAPVSNLSLHHSTTPLFQSQKRRPGSERPGRHSSL